MTQPVAIAVEEVTFYFGRIRALDRISLSVATGTVVGIVGSNGAGKTTLIDVVCGLLRPDQGQVTVLGQPVAGRERAVRRQIGVLPQETALYEEVTAWQNLRFAAALYGVRNADARIAAGLRLIDLTARRNDPVHTLTGGMRRRLAIIRALLHDPILLILDEPTLGVDVEARHQIWSHVRGLRAQGRTVLLTTNYMDEAQALCDRVVILRAGRVVADAAPAALLARAGRCLELDCPPEAAQRLLAALSGNPAVLRTAMGEGGITLYLNGHSSADELVREAMGLAPLSGFRMRPADLVEVFRALAADPAA